MQSLYIKLLKNPLILAICLVLQGCGYVQSTNKNSSYIEATAMVGSLEEDEFQSVSEQRFEPRRPEGMWDDYNAPQNLNATQIHIVQKGDTLTSIAKRYQVSVVQLMQENHLTDKNRIYVGQQLVIPDGGTVSSVASGSDYYVQKGDTLTSIAKRFGMSVNSLKDLNHLTGDMIRVGQVLTVSGNGSVVSTPVNSVTPKNTTPIQGSSYTVQKGDSLWSIARRKGITVQELCSINNLSDSSVLQIGQELKLEGDPRDIVNGSDSVFDTSTDTTSVSSESSINDSFSDLLDSTQDVPTVQIDK